jgi:calcium-dependent protein kinase
MLYIMLCGYPPFYGEEKSEILAKIFKGELVFDGKICLLIKIYLIDEIWGDISFEAKDLISKMLTKEEIRPTAA